MQADQQLLVDFNEALTPDDAIHVLSKVSDPRIMWEEPCNNYDDSVRVARAIQAPVMFDQCLTDLGTYARAMWDGVAAEIRLRIYGWWASQIAGAGALHLSSGTPAETLLASIDLTDPLDTDRGLILKPAPDRVAPASGPGLGPISDEIATCFD